MIFTPNIKATSHLHDFIVSITPIFIYSFLIAFARVVKSGWCYWLGLVPLAWDRTKRWFTDRCAVHWQIPKSAYESIASLIWLTWSEISIRHLKDENLLTDSDCCPIV